MRKILTSLAFLFVAGGAGAIELYSHVTYPGQKFFDYANWVPTSVATNWTPGSDCTIRITTTTNWVFGAWQLSSDSKVTWYLGTDPYLGNTPVWDGSQWSPVSNIFDTQGQSYGDVALSVTGTRDEDEAVDERGTDLHYYLHGDLILIETGEELAEDDCTAHYERTVSNTVTAVTNVIPTRLTPELHASFFRTLDGWCEREYFTGLAYPEPNHNLWTTPLLTIGTNRVCESRRLVGITNLWDVADRLVEISNNGWRGGTASNYTYRVSPYWSSQTFDDIYGDQLPTAIAWTSAGLGGLTNKCAVLQGLTNSVVWGGMNTNGWLYAELYPEDFAYGLTNQYSCGRSTPGHAFDFETLCATNHIQIVDAVTNQTHRLNVDCWAGVNQAMSEMDRTLNPVGAVPASTGTRLTYTRVRKYESPVLSFEDIGLVYEGEAWKATTDIGGFSFSETTNYWVITTNAWSTDSANSDAVELTGNDVDIHCRGESWQEGYLISASSIARALTSWGITGETNVDYEVRILDTRVSGGYVIVDYTCAGQNMSEFFPSCPTQAYLSASAEFRNSFSLKMAGPPSFTNLRLMPMDQAWESGSGGRVESVRDICTASIGSLDHGSSSTTTNVTMHCGVIARGSDDDVVGKHCHEWTNHHTVVVNDIQTRRGIDWEHPNNYVEFGYLNVNAVLGSIAIEKGTYPQSWAAGFTESVILQIDTNGHWFVKDGSGAGINVNPVFGGFDWDYDTTAHSIPTRYPIEEYCRQRLMNIVDWDWNSIRER